MIESGKKVKDLQEKLSSENPKVIADKITSLRHENPFRGAIALLVNFFDTTDNQEIKDLIRNFLNDIKEPNARNEVIGELKKNYTSATISMLACSCWQSGLDYSDFANEFAEVFVKGDYLTSLECFTVIEESLLNISQSDKTTIISLLEDNIETFATEKITLTRTLISILL
jgi:hypothetical protein